MLTSSLLDTAIGIIFVFLLISLVASTLNEIVLSFVNLRGRMLLRGIQTLLSDKGTQGLVNAVYNHGQVFGLYQGNFNPKTTWRDFIPLFGKDGKTNLPSYIPSTNFALAFLGVLPGAAKIAADNAEQAALAAEAAAKIEKGKLGPSPSDAAKAAAQKAGDDAAAARSEATEAKAAADTAQQSLNDAKTVPVGATPEQRAQQLAAAFTGLKAVATALGKAPSTEKVGKPLLAVLETCGNDFNNLTTAIEKWYDSAMDRVSGWYKYHTQWMLFWIGIVLAVALNANTLAIVKQISQNDALRQSVIAAASNATKPLNQPTTADLHTSLTSLSQEVSNVQGLGLPIGWSGGWPVGEQRDFNFWYRTMLGWLLTAIAVSLGAPFWFDLLNKFMVVRSTVKPHEKSKGEGSKDK